MKEIIVNISKLKGGKMKAVVLNAKWKPKKEFKLGPKDREGKLAYLGSMVWNSPEIRIENIGLYFAKQQIDGIRLTFDGIQLFKDQIIKNIITLNDEQANRWLKGQDLNIKSDNAFKILKHSNEFIGCGKSTNSRITNFVPKERRIKP